LNRIDDIKTYRPLAVSVSQEAETTDEDFIKHLDFENMDSPSGSIIPILLPDGIHYQVNGQSIKQLPRRTERNLKARAHWFGALCFAGIGLFLEAHSKFFSRFDASAEKWVTCLISEASTFNISYLTTRDSVLVSPRYYYSRSGFVWGNQYPECFVPNKNVSDES
jgi:hypothetical protein